MAIHGQCAITPLDPLGTGDIPQGTMKLVTWPLNPWCQTWPVYLSKFIGGPHIYCLVVTGTFG